MEGIELNNDELRSTTISKLDGDPKIGWICNKKGLLLKTYGWLVKNAAGIILLIHGFRVHTRLTFMRINLQMPNNNEDIVVDTNNYYIYKDSWIEKFNQNGYSVYALDLQGHGESQAWNNVRGEFSSFDDLVDDVIQYMNQIQDEISNDNQTNDDILNNNQTNDDILNNNQMNDESYDIVATKKKKLPMYVIGYSMGGNIALRMLQVLNKEKGYNINTGESDNYKKCKAILDNSNHINEIDNDMNNSKNDDPGTSSAGTSATANASTSDKHVEYDNYLDKFNIKGCISLSSMITLNETRNVGNILIKYLYLPVTSLLSRVAPNAKFPSDPDYKQFEYINNTYRYDKFRNPDETKFKYVYELLKATVDVNYNINYMPKDIPLLFLHSSDDSVCHYQGTVSFHSKAKVETKNIYIFDKLDHAITAAPGNEEVLNLIINWINNLRMNDGDKIKHEIEDKKKNEI
ncbi:lysophospholipase, putative [Plasmodium chabaudi chabaudi]|uniref:Lysophospholipase, putative n=2 Tax=Plasmodium chabaudi chabaudi TaxID=31271 RepID=A0A077TN60_PLACU|nr:lysophospholipase, putative [Plasmodium chabaudi chabaudi]SCL88579.1 lysophospholipase, putative [Plasmodium chabaudi chabaudi]VTZ68185.1 lysophospholipase, putative [Plasmodium chabaudi chabaudi]|eukprot:XP_742281.2 lysophospholipase, putative [Plasmodium chabaudi chabaudi]